MPADEFGERFFSGRGITPWHSLGIVSEDEVNANEAWRRMGPYSIELWPTWAWNKSTLTDEDPLKSHLKLTPRAIVRLPVPDHPEPELMAVVGGQYELVDPQTIVDLWDEVVHTPVETMGALAGGKDFFVTTRLPEFDIKGDSVERYLALHSPYDGVSAISGLNTDVRVVCRNTLIAAHANARETFSVRHWKGAKEELRGWLSDFYNRALVRGDQLKELYGLLSERTVSDKRATELVNAVYPMPAPVPDDLPTSKAEQAQKEFEAIVKGVTRNQQSVLALYQGLGTGMDASSCFGTAYGLWNAVCEWEDWRPSNQSQVLTARGRVWGDRANAKRRAFEVILTGTNDEPKPKGKRSRK